MAGFSIYGLRHGLMKADRPISIKEKLFYFISERFSLVGAPLRQRRPTNLCHESYLIFVRM